MKLLIITQTVDTEHPILGFFHRWLLEFAKHCEHVHVIALEVGAYSLPKNVTVHSLGKNEGKSKFTYLLRFFRLIWLLRKEYDSVFVHMNQIYVILGGVLWRVSNKPISLWYMHGSTPLTLRIAQLIVSNIYTGSPESYRLKSSKLVVTGHGIDIEHFSPRKDTIKDIDLITVGRITESKNLILLIDSLLEIQKVCEASLTIVGTPVTESEKVYEQLLHAHVNKLGLTESVHFIGRVSQEKLPDMLSRSKVFVTVAKNGSLDKAVLEAMACGTSVVSMAEGTKSLPLKENQVENQESFVRQVVENIENSDTMLPLRLEVETNHSIKNLIRRICKNLSTKNL